MAEQSDTCEEASLEVARACKVLSPVIKTLFLFRFRSIMLPIRRILRSPKLSFGDMAWPTLTVGSDHGQIRLMFTQSPWTSIQSRLNPSRSRRTMSEIARIKMRQWRG